MRWRRPFLLLAALHAGVWAWIFAVAPSRAFAEVPRWPWVIAVAVVGEGLLLLGAALTPGRLLLGAALLGKILGPGLFAVAVALGWERASSWPWTIVNDVIWIPPLAVLWRRGASA